MIFPTTIEDSNPPISESPDGRMMPLTLCSFVIIVGTSPNAEHNGLGCKLMEALLDKPGAGEASMYPGSFAATLRNRCNAGVLGKLTGGLKAVSVGSHHGQQARCQGRAGPPDLAACPVDQRGGRRSVCRNRRRPVPLSSRGSAQSGSPDRGDTLVRQGVGCKGNYAETVKPMTPEGGCHGKVRNGYVAGNMESRLWFCSYSSHVM